MKIYRSDSLEPYDNLRLEEGLLHRDSDEAVLLFWRSDSAVVLGKNQNPWNECNLDYCAAEEIKVARRITGGGTVYQDQGNLNYALCLPRAGYKMDTLLDLVCDSFRRSGFPVNRFQANGLGIEGRKFSGHAFCYRQDRVLHHGTCLINTDLEKLTRSIDTQKTLDTHAVDSCRATTINLIEQNPGIQQKEIESIFIHAAEHYVSEEGRESISLQELKIAPEHLTVCDSEDWTYLKTPTFTIRFTEGQLTVRRGHIDSIQPEALQSLTGTPFTREKIETASASIQNQEAAASLLHQLNRFWQRP